MDRFNIEHWSMLLRKHTPKTKVVHVPRSFLEYLIQDGVYSTKEEMERDREVLQRRQDEENTDDEWSFSSHVSSDLEEADEIADSSSTDKPAGFEGQHDKLLADISLIIQDLGGKVCPKLGNVCPIDASWVLFGRTTCCQNTQDIITLLKSSTRTLEYIEHILSSGTRQREPLDSLEVNVALALRKWSTLHSSMEFRCFVRNRKLLAVSQRHADIGFPFLINLKDIVVSNCEDFLEEILLPSQVFASGSPQSAPADDFVFDVYIDKSYKVWLIDLSDLDWERTDLLLFSKEDLDFLSVLSQRPAEQSAPQTFRIPMGRSSHDVHEPNDSVGVAEAVDTQWQLQNSEELPWFRCVDDSSVPLPSRSTREAFPLDLQNLSAKITNVSRLNGSWMDNVREIVDQENPKDCD